VKLKLGWYVSTKLVSGRKIRKHINEMQYSALNINSCFKSPSHAEQTTVMLVGFTGMKEVIAVFHDHVRGLKFLASE